MSEVYDPRQLDVFEPISEDFLEVISDDVLENPWWQIEDINHIVKRETPVSGNWSEMGCFKTSTALRSIKWLMKDVEFPTVLIVTTKSGKGTMFKHAHQILPDWTVLNLDTKGISLVMPDGEEKRVGGGLKFIPEEFEMPVLVVTHYHLFSRTGFGQFQTVKVDDPTSPNGKKEVYIKDKNGNFLKKPWTQADHVVNRKWHYIWLDEAHRVKDKDAKWTVVLKRANLAEGGGKHVSTGTGFINRPDEIWSPLNFLDREKYSSYWDFFEEFCEVDAWDGYAKVSGLKKDKIEEFRALVRKMGPRRTLDEVMPHILQPIYTEYEVDLNPIQRRMYDSIKGELYALDQKGVTLHASNVLSLLQRLRAICVATPEVVADYYDPKEDRRIQKIKLVEPSSKIDRVMELLDEMPWEVGGRVKTGDEHKAHVVIFSNFIGPLQLLEARFNKANAAAIEMGFQPEYPYLWMQEKHSDEERFNMWNKLFASGEYRVFMSTLQLGGESISLTGARHVIFLDRSWSPAANAQGVGRIRRPGQTGQPQVVNINAKDTTDKYVKDVVNLKEGWFQEIFGDWKP